MQRAAGSQMIKMLNEMLEEERAAIEAMIGLTAMATDPRERNTMQRIGAHEVSICIGLRDRITAIGGVPSQNISDFAAYVLSQELYPERLRIFAHHQRLVIERLTALLPLSASDPAAQQAIMEMRTILEGDVVWIEERATSFIASRPNKDFRARTATQNRAPDIALTPTAQVTFSNNTAAQAPTVTFAPLYPPVEAQGNGFSIAPSKSEPSVYGDMPADSSAGPVEKPKRTRRKPIDSDSSAGAE